MLHDYFISEWDGGHYPYTKNDNADDTDTTVSSVISKSAGDTGITDIKELFAKAVSTAQNIVQQLLVKGLSDRLSRVERMSGIRKSIRGQDDDISETDKPLWPSFQS